MLPGRITLLNLVAGLLCSSTAISGEFDWVIDKLPRREEISEWKPVVGKVEGQEYLAIQLDVGDSAKDVFSPVLVFARIAEGNAYAPIAVWKIANLNTDLQVNIRNNSIYVRYDTAHHGVYSSTYQFKLSDGAFQLVGIERQSITRAAYAEIMKNFELWEGVSANLMTAKAIVWAQIFDMNNERAYAKWEQALLRHRLGLSATEGKRRKVSIQEVSPIWLKQFNPYSFNSDFLCFSFDHKLRINNSCQK